MTTAWAVISREPALKSIGAPIEMQLFVLHFASLAIWYFCRHRSEFDVYSVYRILAELLNIRYFALSLILL